MIKLIASDIDGTLLTEGTTQINPEIFSMIRKLKEKGIIFAAASGRPYSSMSYLFDSVKEDLIFVAENGAYVCCRGYDMYESLLEWEQVVKWVKEVREIPGVTLTMDTKDALYTENCDADFIRLIREGYHSHLIVEPDVLAQEKQVIKVSVYKPEGIEEVAAKMVPHWEKTLTCAIAGDIWLDFMNPRTNKGNALRSIQETLHITEEETMVFGDNYNDLEMLARAKYSYAMGNAAPAVKEAAAYVADTHENDGVLKVLRTLL